MKDKVVHDLAGFIASGHTDTGERFVAFVAGYADQINACRRLNIDPFFVLTVRISLDPDTWAMLTRPDYTGQPFDEPRALLP